MTDYKNEPPRLTYYKYKCPNGTHLFTLVDDVETCVYCYIEDNSPKAIEALLSKRELEARVDELIYLANHANPMILNRSYIQQRIKTLTNREEK